MIATIAIRKGEKRDIPQVLALIQELALYEKAPQEVITTVESMERDGFGEDAIFKMFVAEEDDKVLGIAVYYTKYSTWKGRCIFLDDLIVTESQRGRNIGKLLFEAVMKVSRDTAANRMEWQVLDWNRPAINFYNKFNAVLDSEWINGKFTREQLETYKF